MQADDTIAAVASAPGAAGVAVLRISGPQAGAIARHLLGRVPRPRHAHYIALHEADGSLLDHGLLLWFPAPHSYTGEDVLELQVHGSPVLLQLLLRRLHALGARLARSGEFSQRAFLNGKLDLAQAEAVADVIAAGSEAALRAAQRSLAGAFSAQVQELQKRLTAVRVQIEAALDFPDEELELLGDPPLRSDLEALLQALAQLLAQTRRGVRLAHGLDVVLVGRPNSGKSSLLNALAGREQAIVSALPGTTRDVLRSELALDDVRVQLADTAGLRDSGDAIEREGVRRARAELATADLALLVTCAADWREDLAWLQMQATPLPPLLRVLNKIDLDGTPSGPCADEGETPCIALSARTGAGLDALRAALRERAGGDAAEAGGAFSARERHVQALLRTQQELLAAQAEVVASGRGGLAELAAEALRRAQSALDELTGVHSSEDLLGSIFGSFCIGK